MLDNVHIFKFLKLLKVINYLHAYMIYVEISYLLYIQINNDI